MLEGEETQLLGRNYAFTPPLLLPSPATAVAPKKWRRSVEYYTAIFQDLIAEGSLTPNSRALCVDTHSDEDVLALKEVGIIDSIGNFKKPSLLFLILGQGRQQPFNRDTFDFVFSRNRGLEQSTRPVKFAAEIGRTLKPGGFLVLHTAAAVKDVYSFNSFLELFNCCEALDTERAIKNIKHLQSIFGELGNPEPL